MYLEAVFEGSRKKRKEVAKSATPFVTKILSFAHFA